ncbi:MAG: MarR family transcriptional regulator [Candidatus Lokiarchaeota archaeon]|nr:MarR family transcriptional regulator [Candidatus Lokiarchaeota archaeon]
MDWEGYPVKITKALEDYIKTIYAIESERGTVAVSDIAEALDVKAPSVTTALRRLNNLGLVRYKPYQDVRLTKNGYRVASSIQERYQVLYDFFQLLGINDDIATLDACEIEHVAHTETIEVLTEFLRFMREGPRMPKWLSCFKEFQESGKFPEQCSQQQAENHPQ